MKNLLFSCLAVMTIATQVFGDELKFDMGTGALVTATAQAAPEDVIVTGSVFVSQVGAVRIFWDGLTVNAGSYSLGLSDSEKAYVMANLPTVTLDLKKIFGVNWMKALTLSVNTGGYDENPARGTTDFFIGKLMVNLTQTVMSSAAVKWEVTESAGAAAFSSRHYDATDATANSVPFYFRLDSKLVVNASRAVVVAISVGAYATIMDKLNGPDEDRFGGYISPSVEINKVWTIGTRAEAFKRLLFKDQTVYQNAYNLTGFVKYSLSPANAKVKHSIQIEVGKLYDETIPVNGGAATDNWFGGARYNVTF